MLGEGGVPLNKLSKTPKPVTIRLAFWANTLPAGSKVRLTLAATSTAESASNLVYFSSVPDGSTLTVGKVTLTVPRAAEADLRMIRALAVLVVALAVGIPAATAGQQDAPGVTPTTVLIGGTVPLTGPAAAFGVVGPGAAAYFAYVNDHGGVNGRKIIYKYYDDAYDPAQTVQLTRQLVQQDNVLAVFNTIGTPNALAVQPLLNQLKVPGLFAGTGASAFNDFKQYPWTMGYLPSFSAEGAIYGRQIAATKPKAKIGVLYENSDFGDDLVAGLKKGLGGKAKIVAALGYEPTDSDVASQVSRLKGAGADTFMIFATPLFAIKAYIDMHKLGWRPQVYVSSVSIEPTVMQIATASTSPATTAGSTSIAFVKDPTAGPLGEGPCRRSSTGRSWPSTTRAAARPTSTTSTGWRSPSRWSTS